MFSPAKAITAGALVFAIGGVLLIAQPFGQQGDTAPAVGTGDAPARPVPFTGLLDCGGTSAFPTTDRATVELDEGTLNLTRERGRIIGPTVRTITDPRLEGTNTITWNKDIFFGSALERSTGVSAGTWRIENDAGAWQGSYHTFDTPVDGAAVATVVFIGEGDYEGLTSIWEVHLTPASARDCPINVRGLTLDGELPAYPELQAE